MLHKGCGYLYSVRLKFRIWVSRFCMRIASGSCARAGKLDCKGREAAERTQTLTPSPRFLDFVDGGSILDRPQPP